MKALLLAAGLGTRLRPITYSIPKCLVPINGKPLIEYWLDMFYKYKFSSVMVNLHYLPDQVLSYLRESPYCNYVETVYEEKLLGTAGTLLKNKNFFEEDTIFFAHGDNLSIFDMNSFVEAHQSRPIDCEITMMTFKTDAPKSCGVVELDQNFIVRGFHEKIEEPPGNLANGAVYILEPSVFDFLISLGKEKIDFSTEVLPAYLGRIFTFFNGQYHRDIGTLDSYLKAKQDFKNLKV